VQGDSHFVPKPLAGRLRLSQHLDGRLVDLGDPQSDRPDRVAPCDHPQAWALLGLAVKRPLVLFGPMGASADPCKGADLCHETLQRLCGQVCGKPKVQLDLVFGQSQLAKPPISASRSFTPFYSITTSF
jgi:hypothetical protein